VGMCSLATENYILLHSLIGGPVHTHTVFSIKPLYLPDMTVAAESGVLQRPSTFKLEVTNSVTYWSSPSMTYRITLQI
jgi:hypothetical protein